MTTSTQPSADRLGSAEGTPAPKRHSKKGVYWILAGLVITGILAGYDWLRRLPRD